MKFNEKILKLRKERGWSQEELADQLGVSRQAVSRWESGSAQPDLGNLRQLSKLFGVTADYLVNDAYESDADLPAVQKTQAEGERRVEESETKSRSLLRRVIGIGMSVLGGIGSFVIYVVSRFVPVMVPFKHMENGEWVYTWSSGHMGYSYRYFIEQFSLEFLVALFWALLLVGLWVALVKEERFSYLRWRMKKRFHKE